MSDHKSISLDRGGLPRDFYSFADRHIGPNENEIKNMLRVVGYNTLDELVQTAIPKTIQNLQPLDLPPALSEHDALAELRSIASQNQIFRSFIGMGYHDCKVPPVVQRNILENPGWYTQYTPYQAEIAQGRLEALLNYQTMVADLTGLPIANASMLDEATAAAEAMTLCYNVRKDDAADTIWLAADCHPQNIAVVETRAEPLGIKVKVGDVRKPVLDNQIFAIVLQYPGTDGAVHDFNDLIVDAKKRGILVVMIADILALALLKSPGELGADVAVGNAQRFGVPLGYGGPHAAYFATKDEYKRKIPGRLVGVSKDRFGQPALRLSLQTREQHIRRDKATSNICTAQVLLAIMSSMYAVYHGPEGIKRIATNVHHWAGALTVALRQLGYEVVEQAFFDTIRIDVEADKLTRIRQAALAAGINLRYLNDRQITISMDETFGGKDLQALCEVFALGSSRDLDLHQLLKQSASTIPDKFMRKSAYLQHPVFNNYHTETKMLRYIRKLEARDLSLTRSMIPLGSCTMKLNATAELYPITWAEFGAIHPFVPTDQAQGYAQMLTQLEQMLAEITGFAGISLQPNAGSQGEYAGLLVIRAYHKSKSQTQRNICLIPKSAHGTNPASAALAGMKVVVVACDKDGNVDLDDLQKKASEHKHDLAALMVTYPSTHGVFEESITQICEIVHANGGQVYMDGANMNAQVGLCRPGKFGPDVCHLNLHKTFCIPHGGGGPGMGPIGVAAHLKPFLPTHNVIPTGGTQPIGPVSAAPWGSASILPISWMYIRMMGAAGLRRATEIAILNANYIAKQLDAHYPVLYKGKAGLVAHECIVDVQAFKAMAGIDVDDLAKRLMDYGFHAPTVSFPVPNTMMIEPTESEAQDELDRFCEAMIAMRAEVKKITDGTWPKDSNPLKNAPHTVAVIAGETWTYPYTRQEGAFPKPWVAESKFWPHVGRVDNAYGDRNLVCTCLPIEAYT